MPRGTEAETADNRTQQHRRGLRATAIHHVAVHHEGPVLTLGQDNRVLRELVPPVRHHRRRNMTVRRVTADSVRVRVLHRVQGPATFVRVQVRVPGRATVSSPGAAEAKSLINQP